MGLMRVCGDPHSRIKLRDHARRVVGGVPVPVERLVRYEGRRQGYIAASMFLLVTGASGVGKSTVRRLLEAEFAEVLETAELATLGDTPQWTLAWRHRMVERMVRRALAVQRAGKHFLLCGDPAPPGDGL